MPVLEAASGAGVIFRAPSRRVRRLLENLEAYGFLLPAIVVLGVFHLFPIVFAFFISLLKWNMIDPVRPYVGLANYVQALQDDKFRTALGNTTYYAFVSVGLAIPLALFFAVLLNRKLGGLPWSRPAFFTPLVARRGGERGGCGPRTCP